MQVRVQSDPFDPGAELNAFSAANAEGDAGAVVTFNGVVRDVDGGLEHMEIEHYPGMTESALTDMTQNAIERWALQDALVIHRFGRLVAGDVIMMVATAAPHRKDAFEAAEFMMDYLKSRAPFWKKEQAGGDQSWVAARDDDEAALDRWSS